MTLPGSPDPHQIAVFKAHVRWDVNKSIDLWRVSRARNLTPVQFIKDCVEREMRRIGEIGW